MKKLLLPIFVLTALYTLLAPVHKCHATGLPTNFDNTGRAYCLRMDAAYSQLPYADYQPIVIPGKTWHVLEFAMGGEMRYTPRIIEYTFDDEAVFIDGQKYLAMSVQSEGKTSNVGLFREEYGKIYHYVETSGTDALVYDFTLQPGDEFTVPDHRWKCEVTSVSILECNGIRLRTLNIAAKRTDESESSEVCYMEWIEGIGSAVKPILTPDDVNNINSRSSHVAYAVTRDGATFLPMTFGLPWHGYWGTLLAETESRDSQNDRLTYALEPSDDGESYSLRIHGSMEIPTGPHNYIYAMKDYNSRKVSLQIVALPPFSDGVAKGNVDITFPFFSADNTYTDFSIEIAEPFTGISAQKADSTHTTLRQSFDLTGRRLTAPPSRGVYIYEGRVRVKQ